MSIDEKGKRLGPATVITLVLTASIAVTGWLFGALQSAGAQSHTVIEKRLDKVEIEVGNQAVDDAVTRTVLESIQSDVKEIKELIKKDR